MAHPVAAKTAAFQRRFTIAILIRSSSSITSAGKRKRNKSQHGRLVHVLSLEPFAAANPSQLRKPRHPARGPPASGTRLTWWGPTRGRPRLAHVRAGPRSRGRGGCPGTMMGWLMAVPSSPPACPAHHHQSRTCRVLRCGAPITPRGRD